MKCNQWTLGLAAVGVVSMASVALADAPAAAAPATPSVLTAVPTTTLSGFVDTSMVWNLGTHNSEDPSPGFAGAGGHDGFNLNVVDLNLESDPVATDGWGSGYRVELWAGPQANSLATSSDFNSGDFAVKNAYVELKAPVGNGLDIKVGVFDTIIGYEVADGPNNPNFTRSLGFGVEPTTHTGVLLGYTINDMISVQAGIADSYGPTINQTGNDATTTIAESYKTWMGSVTLTAPKDWGWVAGSTLFAGVINGFNSADGFFSGADQTSFYTGVSLNTPMKELKVGASYDYVAVGKQADVGVFSAEYAYVIGTYATYQATEKLSVNARAEYGSDTANAVGTFLPSTKVIEGTVTVQYDLWKNVLSRVEMRWDHDSGSHRAFGEGDKNNAYAILGNIVYKF